MNIWSRDFQLTIYKLPRHKSTRIKRSISIHLCFRLTNGLVIDVLLDASDIIQHVAKRRY